MGPAAHKEWLAGHTNNWGEGNIDVMNEWVYGWMNACMHECTNERMSAWMSAFIYACMNDNSE